MFCPRKDLVVDAVTSTPYDSGGSRSQAPSCAASRTNAIRVSLDVFPFRVVFHID